MHPSLAITVLLPGRHDEITAVQSRWLRKLALGDSNRHNSGGQLQQASTTHCCMRSDAIAHAAILNGPESGGGPQLMWPEARLEATLHAAAAHRTKWAVLQGPEKQV